METQDAYNKWSSTYDLVVNKTRDLESVAIRSVLQDVAVERILEIGCGTGKNTEWLARKCAQLTAVDFSKEMLQVAQQKIKSEKVQFEEADITRSWNFAPVNLVTCSLVLEHIHNIHSIFKEAAGVLHAGGRFYLCELHPYKQLQGSRAAFEKDGMRHEVEYFIHHISDYVNAANAAGLTCKDLQEWFDSEDRSVTPRLVSFLFLKA